MASGPAARTNSGRQLLHPRSKRQIRSLTGLVTTLSGTAAGIDALLRYGFEPTFTPAIAAGIIDDLERSVRSLNHQISKIRQHATEVAA
jgi:hypothetical protein